MGKGYSVGRVGSKGNDERKDDFVIKASESQEKLLAAVETAVKRHMDENVPEVVTDGEDQIDRWGGCPECHKNDGFIFYDKDIYFVCRAHRLKWFVGSGLLSAWQHMTEAALFADKLLVIFGFKSVEPWHPPKRCTMADGTEKLATELKPGDIVIVDGEYRREVENVSEDGSITYRGVPNPCPTCGHAAVDESEMPF